jgi:hypothetical protein
MEKQSYSIIYIGEVKGQNTRLELFEPCQLPKLKFIFRGSMVNMLF